MTEKMDSLGVCPECCKSYDEPILLPCLHNFCRKCIAGISETTGSRSQAACPQCQEQFAIPKAGVDGLPRNSFLENYLKLKDICGSSDQPCDLCNSDDADAEQLKFATVYCLVCRQKFCSSCASIHSKINVCRKHEQINLGEEDVDSVSAMIKSPTICDKHRQKRLKYYCGTCRQALCQLCYVEKHQSHKCSDLAEPAEKLREQVKKDTTSLTELLEECRRMLAKVSSDNDTFDDQIISIENELHARADQLKDEIDREVEQLLEEMAVIRKKRSEEVEKACDEIKQRMASLEHGMSYIEELATKGSPGDILQQTRVIQDRTLRLKNFDSIRQAFKGLGSTTVKFVPSGVSNGVGTKLIGKVISGNSNGKVVPERSTEEVADKNEDGRAVSTKSNGPNGQMACDSSIRKTQGEEVDNVSVVSIEKESIPESRTGSRVIANGSGTVTGVTVIGDQIFIVRYNGSKQVQVHNRNTLALVRNMMVKQATSLFGLVSCSDSNCLFLSDHGGHKIHKVDLSSTDKDARWTVAKNPLGLSLSKIQTILVACNSVNKIQEYDAEGKLMREMLLRSGDNKPIYVRQLTGGQLVVSYGELLWSRCVVSLVKDDGIVEYTFCENDSSLKSLKGSTEVELDSNGNVLVADWTKHRIMVLSRSLRWLRDLQLEIDGGLKQPYALHFDETRGQLIVGEYAGRVVVFDGVHTT